MLERTLKSCHWSLVIGHWEIGGMGEWGGALVKHGQINARGEYVWRGEAEPILCSLANCHRCHKRKRGVVTPSVTVILLIIKDLHGVSQVSQAKCDILYIEIFFFLNSLIKEFLSIIRILSMLYLSKPFSNVYIQDRIHVEKIFFESIKKNFSHVYI